MDNSHNLLKRRALMILEKNKKQKKTAVSIYCGREVSSDCVTQLCSCATKSNKVTTETFNVQQLQIVWLFTSREHSVVA